MSIFFHVYMVAWGLACLLSILLYLKERETYSITKSSYWRFICKPWKLITFFCAATGMTVIAPYTGDPTWDYFDALFMAVLTFLSAPWAVGALYKTVRRQLPWRQGYVAVCLWMFSASWSYDLYLVCRDGYYPVTWDANILLSSILYLSAGLLWNLEWRPERGVTFGFLEGDWPNPATDGGFPKILWFALPFIILVAILIVSFVVPFLG